MKLISSYTPSSLLCLIIFPNMKICSLQALSFWNSICSFLSAAAISCFNSIIIFIIIIVVLHTLFHTHTAWLELVEADFLHPIMHINLHPFLINETFFSCSHKRLEVKDTVWMMAVFAYKFMCCHIYYNTYSRVFFRLNMWIRKEGLINQEGRKEGVMAKLVVRGFQLCVNIYISLCICKREVVSVCFCNESEMVNIQRWI